MIGAPNRQIDIADCVVRINGRPLPPNAIADLVAVTVNEDVAVPSMFTLRLITWDVATMQVTWADRPLFAEGNPLEIQIGYSGNLVQVMAGEITGLEPEFVAGETPMLTVRGYDRRHRLMRGNKTRSFTKLKDSQIAGQIAADNGLQARVVDSGATLDYVLQHNQTDLEFLQERAGRIGYEVVVEDRTLFFRPPQHKQSPVVTLRHDVDLIEFFPRLSTMGQVGAREAHGWDVQKKAPIVAKAAAGSEAAMGGLNSGPRVVNKAFGTSSAADVDHPVASPAEAARIAAGRFEALALQFVQGTGMCVGNPRVRAGRVIKIEGVGRRFSGNYYVTAATHSYTPQRGYRTEFEVRRTAT